MVTAGFQWLATPVLTTVALLSAEFQSKLRRDYPFNGVHREAAFPVRLARLKCGLSFSSENPSLLRTQILYVTIGDRFSGEVEGGATPLQLV